MGEECRQLARRGVVLGFLAGKSSWTARRLRIFTGSSFFIGVLLEWLRGLVHE
jgi:hypothetical protein